MYVLTTRSPVKMTRYAASLDLTEGTAILINSLILAMKTLSTLPLPPYLDNLDGLKLLSYPADLSIADVPKQFLYALFIFCILLSDCVQ